jgi:hypothetical protein
LILGAAIIVALWKSNSFAYLLRLSDMPEVCRAIAGLGFLGATLGLFYLADRLYVSLLLRGYGHDPHQLHWSERLNRAGHPFCPVCGSPYICRPDSGLGTDTVFCGDCGFTIATLDEMRPFLEKRAKQLH